MEWKRYSGEKDKERESQKMMDNKIKRNRWWSQD